MKSASASLIAMLATAKQFVMTETYTFTLADGSTLVYRSGDYVNSYSVSSSEPQANLTH